MYNYLLLNFFKEWLIKVGLANNILFFTFSDLIGVFNFL